MPRRHLPMIVEIWELGANIGLSSLTEILLYLVFRTRCSLLYRARSIARRLSALHFGEQVFSLPLTTTKSFPQTMHCLRFGDRFARCSRPRTTHFSRFAR